jgi:purine-binding chemotaxis protein CheW
MHARLPGAAREELDGMGGTPASRGPELLTSPEITVLIFQVGENACAIRIDAVQELVPMCMLSRAPGQPPLVEGFLNLRGTAVPVLRMNRLFDLPAAPPGLHSPLIVLRGNPFPTALLVDRVSDVVRAQQLAPVGGNVTFNDCAEAEFTYQGGPVYLVSAGRLLLEGERQRVAELQGLAQAYLAEVQGP